MSSERGTNVENRKRERALEKGWEAWSGCSITGAVRLNQYHLNCLC